MQRVQQRTDSKYARPDDVGGLDKPLMAKTGDAKTQDLAAHCNEHAEAGGKVKSIELDGCLNDTGCICASCKAYGDI